MALSVKLPIEAARERLGPIGITDQNERMKYMSAHRRNQELAAAAKSHDRAVAALEITATLRDKPNSRTERSVTVPGGGATYAGWILCETLTNRKDEVGVFWKKELYARAISGLLLSDQAKLVSYDFTTDQKTNSTYSAVDAWGQTNAALSSNDTFEADRLRIYDPFMDPLDLDSLLAVRTKGLSLEDLYAGLIVRKTLELAVTEA
jgi:hypothetical protein